MFALPGFYQIFQYFKGTDNFHLRGREVGTLGDLEFTCQIISEAYKNGHDANPTNSRDISEANQLLSLSEHCSLSKERSRRSAGPCAVFAHSNQHPRLCNIGELLSQ